MNKWMLHNSMSGLAPVKFEDEKKADTHKNKNNICQLILHASIRVIRWNEIRLNILK